MLLNSGLRGGVGAAAATALQAIQGFSEVSLLTSP